MAGLEYIEKFIDGCHSILNALSREDIDAVVNVLYRAWQEEKRVFIMGNGGSASTASHFACDLSKWTIAEDKKRFKVIGLTDNIPLMSAWINDAGFENLFAEQMKNHFQPGDIVIGISVHGGSGKDRAGQWSQNLIKAMETAKENGGITIGFSGFDGGIMKNIAQYCIVVPFNTTPHVESFHVVLEHLICERLRQLIAEKKE